MRFPLLLLLGSVFLVGCGSAPEKYTTVKGKVHKGGTPLQVSGADVGTGFVQVDFYPLDAGGQIAGEPESTHADAEGNFTIGGTTGPGLKPGKYRVAVYQYDPYPDVDKLNGQFSKENSPIVKEIPEGQEEVEMEIDLANPQ